MQIFRDILLWFNGLYLQSIVGLFFFPSLPLSLTVVYIMLCMSLICQRIKGRLFFADGIEDHEKELEHSTMQDRLDRELKELDKKLEQKEVCYWAFRFFIYDVFFKFVHLYCQLYCLVLLCIRLIFFRSCII